MLGRPTRFATRIATGETAWRARGFTRASMLYADHEALILEEDGDLSLATAHAERYHDPGRNASLQHDIVDGPEPCRDDPLRPGPGTDRRPGPRIGRRLNAWLQDRSDSFSRSVS